MKVIDRALGHGNAIVNSQPGSFAVPMGGGHWGSEFDRYSGKEGGLDLPDDKGAAKARGVDILADAAAARDRSWSKKRRSVHMVAPVFDARGDGIVWTWPAGDVQELQAREGYGWLRTEPDTVRAIALKINNLGQHALEGAFSVDELERIHNLIDARKVRSTVALDLPGRKVRYTLIKRRSRSESPEKPRDQRLPA